MDDNIVVRFHRAMARIFAGKATEAQIRKFHTSSRKEYDSVMLGHVGTPEFKRLQALGDQAFMREMDSIKE